MTESERKTSKLTVCKNLSRCIRYQVLLTQYNKFHTPKMDTIRMKIHLLKVETSETINRLLSVESAATRNTEQQKDLEKQLRLLMKEVSKKDNGMLKSFHELSVLII